MALVVHSGHSVVNLTLTNVSCWPIRYFKQTVSLTSSAVKIPDEVPRDDPATVTTVVWTSQLNDVFKLNAAEDEQIRCGTHV